MPRVKTHISPTKGRMLRDCMREFPKHLQKFNLQVSEHLPGDRSATLPYTEKKASNPRSVPSFIVSSLSFPEPSCNPRKANRKSKSTNNC